jgi:hypothetical protein
VVISKLTSSLAAHARIFFCEVVIPKFKNSNDSELAHPELSRNKTTGFSLEQ